MKTITLDQAIDLAMQLPLEQREMLLQIIRQRDIELRRDEIAKDARTSIGAYRAGKLKAQSVDQVMQELRQTLKGKA
jgi:hypothetical protein